MKFKVKIPKPNFKRFAELQKGIDEANRQIMGIAALEIRNEAVKLINDNSDGPKQRRYQPKRTVNVSPAGTPPNTDTGRLVQSIQVARDGDAYKVGTNLMYGAYLEFGTQDMAPRPWLSIALKIASKKISQIADTIYNKFGKDFIK